ncbi:MAG: uracil-DNA glycosylase [Alphaproteobacteria bacterium]|jgi:DNA polymerase|nr:uracil-DNA glycosylase [Alphaproteobacteria bacterium]
MNSNKIISLVKFYQSMGIDYLADSPALKSLVSSPIEVNNMPKKINTPQEIPTPNLLNLSHINTLEELKQELLNFDGCSLKKTAINTVFGAGNQTAEIMVIGEAPGADEDEQGEPFVGRSGKLLMAALASVGLSRENIFITNTIFWRPPGNRNPTIEEMQLCYPFLSRMIEIINPKMIIIVGKVATSNLIKIDLPISKMRGKWYDIAINNKNFSATIVFHPSYLLRNPSQKKAMWLDLLEIKDKIHSMEINI